MFGEIISPLHLNFPVSTLRVLPYRLHADSMRKVLEINPTFKFEITVPVDLLSLDLRIERLVWAGWYYVEVGEAVLPKMAEIDCNF